MLPRVLYPNETHMKTPKIYNSDDRSGSERHRDDISQYLSRHSFDRVVSMCSCHRDTTVTNNIVPMDVRDQQSQHHHSHYDRQYQFEETIIITTVFCRSDDLRYERASTPHTLETTASYNR